MLCVVFFLFFLNVTSVECTGEHLTPHYGDMVAIELCVDLLFFPVLDLQTNIIVIFFFKSVFQSKLGFSLIAKGFGLGRCLKTILVFSLNSPIVKKGSRDPVD